MDELERGEWRGGKHYGNVHRMGSVFYVVVRPGIARIPFPIKDYPTLEAARAAAKAKQAEISIAARLSKNRYRRVRSPSTGEEWWEMQIGHGMLMWFDDCDLELATTYTWFAYEGGNSSYAGTNIKCMRYDFHILALGVAGIDHIDLDGSLSVARAAFIPHRHQQPSSEHHSSAA
jgi:hypothetical protein